MQKVPHGTRTVPAPSALVLTEHPSVHPHPASPLTACTPLKPLVGPWGGVAELFLKEGA